MQRGVVLVSSIQTIRNRALLAFAAIGVVGISGAQAPDLSKASSQLKAKRSSFTENRGQWNSKALFHSRSAGMDFWISREGFVFEYARTTKDNSKFAGHAVGMLFEGANKFQSTGIDASGTKQFLQASKGVTTKDYQKVKLTNVYNGIDVVTYHENKIPRYDFIVKPGAKVGDIRLGFKGTSAAKVVEPTKLSVETVFGKKFQQGLFAYQMVAGQKKSIPVSFKQIDATHIGFSVGSYDASKELVIDPLVYGTYYGGDQGFDEVRGVGADTLGNVYLTGYTKSAIYPVLYGPFGFNLQGGKDAFLSRLQGDAYNHDYSALLAGSGDDQGNFLQIDPFGNVWVLGSTRSANFPPFAGSPNANGGNIWLARFAPSQSTVLDPFIGGVPTIYRFGGSVTTPNVGGITSFSMQQVANPTPGSAVRMIMTGRATAGAAVPGVTELGATGNQGAFYLTLQYTEAGGFQVVANNTGYVNFAAPATAVSITGSAFDTNGNFFLNGTLTAAGNSDTAQGTPAFTTTAGVFTNGRLQRQSDIWVRRYAPTGTLSWSGLLGGASIDVTEGFNFTHQRTQDIAGTTVATDLQGNCYVLGRSTSFDFPRTRGVFGEAFASGGNYVTVTKVSADGTQILYSTNLRNGGGINTAGIGVDQRGNAYVTGQAFSTSAIANPPPDPVEPNAHNNPGNIPLKDPIRAAYTFPAPPEMSTMDGWLVVLNSDATDIIRGTYVGGFLDDAVFAPYVDPRGDVWVYGWSDTWRYYFVVSSTGTVTERAGSNGTFGGLDAGFITALAFKQTPEPNGGQGVDQENGVYFYTGGFGPVSFPRAVSYRRDGFLLRFRESLPLISSLTLNPISIPGGDPAGTGAVLSSTGTVVLSAPAPVGGATINLSLDNGSVGSFLPTSGTTTSTISIPAGQTTGTFLVYGRQVPDVSNVQVKADYSGNIKVAALQVVPWLSSLTLSSGNVVGGNEVTGIITLAANAPTGGAIVTLGTDRPDLVTFPGGNTVVVAAGANTATVQIATNGVDINTNVQVNATLLGVTRIQSLGINPARLNRVALDPDTIAASSSTTGKVILDGKAGSNMTVNLSVQGNPAGYVITPVTVTIPAGATESPAFTVQTPYELANRTRVVQAVRVNGVGTVIDGPVTGLLTVTSLRVRSVTLDPTTIPSGGTSSATVVISGLAPAGGVTVNLDSDRPDVAVPVDANGAPVSSVFIAEGTDTATVPILGLFALDGDTDVNISAYLGPTPFDAAYQVSETLTVEALTYTLTLNPSEVPGGNPSTGTITLSAPAIAGFSMVVDCNDPSVTFTQPVFEEGNATATFNIQTPEVTETKTVIFSTSVGSLPVVTAPLTIRGTEVILVKILPSNRARQLAQITIEVTLNRTVTASTTGTIRFSNATLVQLPGAATTASFTVLPGTNKARVTLRTRRVPRNLSTTVTGSVSSSPTGPSASTTLTVIR